MGGEVQGRPVLQNGLCGQGFRSQTRWSRQCGSGLVPVFRRYAQTVHGLRPNHRIGRILQCVQLLVAAFRLQSQGVVLLEHQQSAPRPADGSSGRDVQKQQYRRPPQHRGRLENRRKGDFRFGLQPERIGFAPAGQAALLRGFAQRRGYEHDRGRSTR